MNGFLAMGGIHLGGGLVSFGLGVDLDDSDITLPDIRGATLRLVSERDYTMRLVSERDYTLTVVE